MTFPFRAAFTASVLTAACLLASGCSGGGPAASNGTASRLAADGPSASGAVSEKVNSGAGVGEPMTAMSVKEMSAAQVARAAVTDLRSVPGFTMSGQVAGSGGTTIKINLRYQRGVGCKGTLGEGAKGSFAVIVIGGTAWVKPSATFWRSLGVSAGSSLRGKYLRGSATSGAVAQLAALCDVRTLTSRVDLPANVRRHPATRIGEQWVIPLTANNGNVTLYVTEVNSPRVVRLVNKSRGTNGRLSFTYGTPVTLTPPPASHTVNAARYGF